MRSLILVEHQIALGLADALHDDLLGRLRGDASEFFGRHFDVEVVADLVLVAGLRRADLDQRVGDFFDHRAAREYTIRTIFAIDDHDGIAVRFSLAREIALVCGHERGF